MARTRSFDPTEALDAVLQVFWSRGYARTSIADLVEATGVNRHSLYALWKDKDGLYAAALERYEAVTRTRVLDGLTKGGRGAIAAHLRALAAMANGEARDRGCFALNSMVVDPKPPRVDEILKRHLAAIERAYSSALEVAVRQGELPADLDVAAHAAHLAISSQALLLQAKTGASPESLERYIDITLRTLDAPLRREEIQS